MRPAQSIALIALVLLLSAASAPAFEIGQIDNFQDGTLQSWNNGEGSSAPPVLNIDTGGPAGAGDHFLQLTADGNGAGNRLTVFNRAQWIGDYIGAGLTAIELDLRNQGSVTLHIRLAFKDLGGPNAPGYLTAASFTLLPGSGWQHAVFLVNPGSMLARGGPTPFNVFFAGAFGEFRIINELGTNNLNGDIVVGQLGVDNIHAIPEPTVASLTAAGMLAVIALRGRKRD
ncbi:MAG: hypothetical protein ABJB09_04320 [Verrucomicrobiota bacterium]